MIDVVIGLSACLGAFFMVIAATGMLRLADFYQRIHAPTKAATLGLVFLLVAAALALKEQGVVTKAMLAVIFFAVTAPVGAHLLCRAAYRRGVKPAKETQHDDYRDVWQQKHHKKFN